MFFLAKYNTQTTFYFTMIKRGTTDLAVGADWTPAAADAKMTKDGGTPADCTNTIAILASGGTRTTAIWSLTLTATELSAGDITVQVVDAATKAVEDQAFKVYTYGNSSAIFPFDFSDLVRGGLTALPNANAEAAGGLYTRGTGAGQINQDGNGRIDTNTAAVSGDTTAADNLESEYDGTGYGQVLQRTTIASLSSQTSFTLTAGSADNDAYNDCIIVVQDGTTAAQKAVGVVDDYVGSSKTVTLRTDPAVFTMANGDTVTIIADRALKPTVMNRTLDVSTGGEAGVDWNNIGSPTTAQNLSGTTVKTATDVETDTADIQSRLPAALVSGRIDASVGAMAADTVTASAIADGAIDAGAIASDTITAAKIADAAIDAATFAADVSTYQAKIWLIDDDAGTTDRYVVVYYKNGQPVTSGITSPTIQVYKVSDGSDLIASTALTQIASTGTYRYNATGAERGADGVAYIARVQATIDSSTRSWYQPVGRDG